MIPISRCRRTRSGAMLHSVLLFRLLRLFPLLLVLGLVLPPPFYCDDSHSDTNTVVDARGTLRAPKPRNDGGGRGRREERDRVPSTLGSQWDIGQQAHESALLKRHNVIIVPVLDGKVHAVDVVSGKVKWSFSSGRPLVSNLHLLSTKLAMYREIESTPEYADMVGEDIIDEDMGGRPNYGDEPLYFPGTDGALYSYRPGKDKKLRKLGVDIKKLVDASPSLTSRGLVAVGERRTTVFMLDSTTGDVLQEFPSKNDDDGSAWKTLFPEELQHCLVMEEELEQSEEEERMAPDTDEEEPQARDKMVCKRRPLFISRTDWNVTWFDATTRRVTHNLGFAEVKTLDHPFSKENTQGGVANREGLNDATASPQLPAGSEDLQPRQSLRLLSEINSNSLRLMDIESGIIQWRVSLDARPIVAFSMSGDLISKLDPVENNHQVEKVFFGEVHNQVYVLSVPWKEDLPSIIPLGPSSSAVALCKPVETSPLERVGSKHLVLMEMEMEMGDDLGEDEVKDPGEQYKYLPSNNPNALDLLPAKNPLSPRGRFLWCAYFALHWYVLSAPLSAFVALIAFLTGLALYIFGKLTGMNGKGREQSAREKKKPGTAAKRKRPPQNVSKVEPNAESGPTQDQKQKLMSDVRKNRPEELPEGEDGRYVNNRLFVSTKTIGYGSHGTIVVEGKLNGRPVAIKRLLLQFHEKAEKEIRVLIASDEHPNVVRLYAMEEDSAFVYVALERCNFSLSDLVIGSSGYDSTTGSTNCSIGVPTGPINSTAVVVKDPHGIHRPITKRGRDAKELIVQLWDERTWPTPVLVQLMKDIVAGLAHLHSVGIVHRDLKPQNVLVCTMSNRQLRAKLSDMGISKRLEAEQSSFTQSHTTGLGSAGWQAPEQLLHGRQTRSVDMFSLGCVLFFCVSGGCHPFGDKFERDRNIINGQVDLFPVKHVPEAFDLIGALLDRDATRRPTAASALMHPLLWSPDERLSFLKDASDRVEGEDRVEGDSQLLMKLEDVGPFALGGSWDEKLGSELLENLGKYRRYNAKSVRDLLRVIRNKLNHFRELPLELQELLGPVPEGYELYFRRRFPHLLMEVYKVLYEFCLHEQHFSKYFYNPEGKDSS